MPRLFPIHWKRFEKFLLHVDCHFVRQSGAHRIYRREDLARPVVVTVSKRGVIPKDHIKTNLFTLKIEIEDYLRIIETI